MSDRAFKALAKAVDKADADKFSDGDVIRWQFLGSYTYVAVRANKRWFISGTVGTYNHNGVQYETLTKYLADERVSAIQYATSWSEPVKETPDDAWAVGDRVSVYPVDIMSGSFVIRE